MSKECIFRKSHNKENEVRGLKYYFHFYFPRFVALKRYTGSYMKIYKHLLHTLNKKRERFFKKWVLSTGTQCLDDASNKIHWLLNEDLSVELG